MVIGSWDEAVDTANRYLRMVFCWYFTPIKCISILISHVYSSQSHLPTPFQRTLWESLHWWCWWLIFWLEKIKLRLLSIVWVIWLMPSINLNPPMFNSCWNVRSWSPDLRSIDHRMFFDVGWAIFQWPTQICIHDRIIKSTLQMLDRAQKQNPLSSTILTERGNQLLLITTNTNTLTTTNNAANINANMSDASIIEQANKLFVEASSIDEANLQALCGINYWNFGIEKSPIIIMFHSMTNKNIIN